MPHVWVWVRPMYEKAKNIMLTLTDLAWIKPSSGMLEVTTLHEGSL